MFRYDPSGQEVVTEEMVDECTHDGILHVKWPSNYIINKIHLGDTLMMCALATHYKHIVFHWMHDDPGNSVMHRLYPMFSHACTIENVYSSKEAKTPASAARWMWQLGIDFPEPRLNEDFINDKPFVTTQFRARAPGRSIKPEDQKPLLDMIPEDYDVIDLSDNKDSLEQLFSLVKAAEYHMGCNSGITWVASCVRTPVKTLITKTNFPNNLCEFAVLMDRHPNVEIVRDDLIGG